MFATLVLVHLTLGAQLADTAQERSARLLDASEQLSAVELDSMTHAELQARLDLVGGPAPGAGGWVVMLIGGCLFAAGGIVAAPVGLYILIATIVSASMSSGTAGLGIFLGFFIFAVGVVGLVVGVALIVVGGIFLGRAGAQGKRWEEEAGMIRERLASPERPRLNDPLPMTPPPPPPPQMDGWLNPPASILLATF